MSGNKQKKGKTSPKRKAPRSAWKPGQSGNPAGRPKTIGYVRVLAKEYTEEAIETLVEIMRDGEKDTARVKAAEVILDRAWGRAPACLEVTGAEGGPIQFKEIKHELAGLIAGIAARQREITVAGKPN